MIFALDEWAVLTWVVKDGCFLLMGQGSSGAPGYILHASRVRCDMFFSFPFVLIAAPF
jgi:hypothetical protein